MVLSSAARRARSLRCHLCSSQAVPSSWGAGRSSQVMRFEESTTEEHIFGEQCLVSGCVPCFPLPLPLPGGGGPTRRWLPAAALPASPRGSGAPERSVRGPASPGAPSGGGGARGSSRRGGARGDAGEDGVLSQVSGRSARRRRGRARAAGGTERSSSPSQGRRGGSDRYNVEA